MYGALLELSENRKPKILFTSGHGERRIDDFAPSGFSQAEELLGRDNFDLETWTSLGQTSVPEEVDLVVIAGSTARFAESEVEALAGYLANGGRLLAMFDPSIGPAGELEETGLEELLRGYGIEVGADVVVDPANPLPFYGAETIFASAYGEHPITRSLQQTQLPVILSLSRSVAATGEIDGLTSTELVLTSDEGWGETDLSDLSQVALGDEDLAGPVPLGVAVASIPADEPAATGEVEELSPEPQAVEGAGEPEDEEMPPAETRTVVFGDSDFAGNAQLLNVGNAELLTNSMNWLVDSS